MRIVEVLGNGAGVGGDGRPPPVSRRTRELLVEDLCARAEGRYGGYYLSRGVAENRGFYCKGCGAVVARRSGLSLTATWAGEDYEIRCRVATCRRLLDVGPRTEYGFRGVLRGDDVVTADRLLAAEAFLCENSVPHDPRWREWEKLAGAFLSSSFGSERKKR